MPEDSRNLHRDAIIIDATCPLLFEKEHLKDYQAGGLTAVAPTVGGWHGAALTLRDLGEWHRILRERDDLLLVRKSDDVRQAKITGRTGIILHFQGSEPFEDCLDLIDAYRALDVGITQIAYNSRNRIGDGCSDRSDSGLSRFGLRVIERMNAVRMIVDCAHTGFRTTMDAIEHSSAPVVISHANPRAVHDSPRNVTDELLRAIAENGGIVGAVGYGPFVTSKPRPSVDDFIDHIAYMCDLIGSDKVTLGIDYYVAQYPYADEAKQQAIYDAHIANGSWTPETNPAPPYYYPQEIETPDKMPALTEAMLRRGFAEEDIRRIYGENWLRIYDAVWGT